MRPSRRLLAAATAAFLLLAPGAFATESDADDAEEPAPKTVAERSPDDEAADGNGADAVVPPVYVPPDRGAPRMRVGATTRGAGELELHVLAPEGIGLTLATQPTLYWFASEPSEEAVTLVLRRTTATEALAEIRLESPSSAGIQRVELADHGVSLTPEVDYQWFVAVAADDGARVAGGGIARVRAPRALAGELAAADDAPARARALARAGIWYDAVDALARHIDAAPHRAERRLALAALLDQVELAAVARTERERAAGRAALDGRAPLPVYSPPRPVRASYPRHLAGLGARTSESAPPPPRLYALAPNHLGVTTQAQPVLYWHLEAPSELGAELSLIPEDASKPLLELDLPGPLAAGTRAVELARHGVRLAPGRRVEWSVALVDADGERRAEPTISVGFIEFRPPEPGLAAELAADGDAGAVFVYARRGLWYEAFDAVIRRLAANPEDAAARLQAGALLEQVGLAPVAEAVRGGRAGAP